MVVVRGPAVDGVEARGAGVSVEEPEIGVVEALFDKMGSRGGDESGSDAVVPVVWIDVEGGEFSVVGEGGIARGHGGGESGDDAVVFSNDGVGLLRVGVCEVVFRRAVFRAELVEVVVGKESAIGGLPCADVDLGYGECVFGLGGSEAHGLSMAWGWGEVECGL